MSTAEAFEFETECWCAGLPLVDRQPLTPSEREALERRTARLLRLWQLTLAGIALLALWPLALGGIPPHGLSEPAIRLLASLVGLGWVLGIPPLGMLAHDLWRARARHRDDLSGDEALVFAGVLDPGGRLDDELRGLYRLGLLHPQAAAPQTLRVLSASHTIFTVAPGGRARFEKARVAEVASGPGYAMRVALPPNAAWLTGEPSVEFLKRTLTHQELAELDAHVRRLRRPRLAGIIMTAYFALLVAALVVEGPLRAIRLHGGLFVLQFVVGALALGLYGRSLRLAWKLRRDMTTGWALTFHRRESFGHEVDAQRGATDPREGMEFLPHSLALWIENGRPARWRNLSARS